MNPTQPPEHTPPPTGTSDADSSTSQTAPPQHSKQETSTETTPQPLKTTNSAEGGNGDAPHQKRKMWGAVVTTIIIIVAILLLLNMCTKPEPQTVLVVAAGDAACAEEDPGAGTDLRCKDKEISDQAVKLNPYKYLGLGDYQYERATIEDYDTIYSQSWGRLKNITVPAVGNQEYKVKNANTYLEYFGDAVKNPEEKYWSEQVGQWKIVVLNSNCTTVKGGCGETSPQNVWLQKTLQENTQKCVLAVWHHPRWSNGVATSDARTSALYETLYSNGVDVLLTGHEANYERFPMLNPQGKPDPAGVREFVVGTGGQVVYDPDDGNAAWRAKSAPIPNEKFLSEHGFLALELTPVGYNWRFITVDGTVKDQGEANCH